MRWVAPVNRLAEPVVAMVGSSLGSGGSKYESGVLSPQGFIYAMPCNSDKVLRIDPASDETILVGSSLGSGGGKWAGGVLSRGDVLP
jgi:hypothetical protein